MRKHWHLTLALFTLLVSFPLLLVAMQATITKNSVLHGEYESLASNAYVTEPFVYSLANAEGLPFAICAAVFVIILIACGVAIRRKQPIPVSLAIAFILLFIPACCSVQMLAGAVDGLVLEGSEHVSSARLGGHVYHLESNYSESYDDTYLLYECDGLGVICRVVHMQRRTENSFSNIGLKVEPTTNTLSLDVDGEIVYRKVAE